MVLQQFMTDDVFFENEHGERIGPFKTKFGSSEINVYNNKLTVKEGDVAIQPLPNGTEMRFIITEINFSSGLGPVSPFYIFSIIKESKQTMEEKMTAHTTFHITDSNVQVGDGNVQNIINSFEQLIGKIDSSTSTNQQKNEAKSLLKSFLNNPTVAAVFGGATSGLLGLIKN